MNSNLIPLNMRTKEKQREITSKGGTCSGEARREKSLLKKAFKALLEMQDEDSPAGSNITNAMAIAIAHVKKAKNGDVQSSIFVRDTAGEKPVEETDITLNQPPVSLVEYINSKGEVVDSGKS